MTPIFCLKRLMLGFTTIYLAELPLSSTYIYGLGSLFSIGYFLNNKPMNSNFFNFMENLNEFAIYVVCYFTFLFTDWIPDIELMYTLGYVFMPIIVLIVIVNILCVIWDMAKSMTKGCREKQAAKDRMKRLQSRLKMQ